MAGQNQPAKKVTRLEDLLVEEVSLVDKPANKRPLLMVKSEDGVSATTEIKTDENGNLVTDVAPIPVPTTPPAPASEPAPTEEVQTPVVDESDSDGEEAEEAEVEKSLQAVAKGFEAISKRLTIPSAARTELWQSLSPIMGRLSTAMAMSDYAQTNEDPTQSDILPLIVAELDDLSKALAACSKSMSKRVAKDVAKAAWSTAFVNDLPDSSFLYIAPGGKKDADGKTTPRTNRMFPVKDGSGKPDPAHVRNALARIPQANIADDVKAKLTAAAKKLLATISASEDGAQKTKAKKSEEDSDLLALTEALESVIEKRGAKMSKDRLTRFNDAMGALAKILAELSQESDPTQKKIPTKKDEAGTSPTGRTAAPIEKSIEAIASTVEKLAAVVEKQGKEIRTVREARPMSNVLPVEKSAERSESAEVSWPLDMNSGRGVDKNERF